MPHTPIRYEAGARSEGAPAAPSALLVSCLACHGLLDLGLDGFKIKARSRLHWWIVNRCLGEFPDNLLHEHKAPKLIDEPVIIVDRAIILAVVHAGSFVRIKPQVCEDRPIHLFGCAKPAAGLIGEPKLEVVDPYRGQRSLREVENLVPG